VAYLSEEEIYSAYQEASDEAVQWRKDYPQYERLADNGLLDDLDENLPEVNDGSLAASLFKLSKRVIKKKMSGRAVALDSADQWITELANIEWGKRILPNAKSKASPRRKWKDAARKAAIYGGQPIITLFVERGSYRGADFIVPYAQDVKLEAGKDSDEDSDIIFWDVYYTKLQIKNMLEQAKREIKDHAQNLQDYQDQKSQYESANADNPDAKPYDQQEPQPYNKWNIALLKEIVASEAKEEERPGNEQPKSERDQKVKKGGIHFCIAFQRGVNAPFSMYYPSKKKSVRTWSNPDPTGDTPVHYLFCYQDFINPYGVGIVKLAGGTQNVLDYMRQADVLATQLGLRPPKKIKGDEDQVDFESLVYAQDADWIVGNADVERIEMSNNVYAQLPARMSMYQTSLQKMIPMGDTSISGTDSGDSSVSKTPAGVKLAAANLSIDDEDFSENIDECYASVAKSMINTHFANMQGSDLIKLDAEEQQILAGAGLIFPQDELGNPSQELEVFWDDARATFDFEVDPDADKTTDEDKQLEGLVKAADFIKDPNTQSLIAMSAAGQPLILGSKKVDLGELVSEILSLTTNNDKILTDITPDEKKGMMMAGSGVDPSTGQPITAPGAPPIAPNEAGAPAPDAGNPAANQAEPSQQEVAAQIEMVMRTYGVDEHTAAAMLEAERQGFEPQEILDHMSSKVAA
jgi:hypothetical protein